MSCTIVGIDCATQDDRLGLAHGRIDDDGALSVERVTLGTAGESASATVSAWIETQGDFLLAMDAPLGWPAPLASALYRHEAGSVIDARSNALFRRETDRVVQRKLNKLPLEVGADRIARTAHAALRLLDEVRRRTGKRIPMAWQQGVDSGAIEVYPAATLIGRGLSPRGYKGASAGGRAARSAILDDLNGAASLGVSRELMVEDDNLLDAMLCVLAGADFALGKCLDPEDRAMARKEGWIWFRDAR